MTGYYIAVTIGFLIGLLVDKHWSFRQQIELTDCYVKIIRMKRALRRAKCFVVSVPLDKDIDELLKEK